MGESPSTSVGLREAKRLLRARALAVRDAMPDDARTAASEVIAAALSTRSDFAGAKVVLMTLPYGSEWDTRILYARALAQAKTVVVPRVNLERRVLDLHVVRDLAGDVAPGYRGIPEPRIDCPGVPPSSIDWVLVPGVAFDVRGQRVGYGGGYYDRLLPMLPPAARRVAGAFELPLVDQVPTAPHDLALDAIVTELRTIVPRPR
jgi:5-formyltetrahydrofolate cyclo-ligase